MGDTLAMKNRVPGWWGEGDEKIYVDGETFPSHFGTGTEDYHGYAWCTPDFFDSPFHCQPLAEGPRNQGHVTNTRVRLLDGIPFTKQFRFDMEIWHWVPIDLINNGVITREIRLGDRELSAGDHRLKVEVTGSNPKAVKRHMFGLDYLKLDPVQ
ncbi:MAG: DUF2961 domain-containing protein [Thermoguttaceae bacterium]